MCEYCQAATVNKLGLPNEIQIGPMRYRVELVRGLRDRDGTRLSGRIDSENATILIDEEQDPQMARITLYHEAIHGILEASGRNGEHDEGLVEALAHGFVDLLQRNTALKYD